MTSTRKSAQFRDVAASTGGTLVKAAKVFGTGSAGIGLQLTTRAYALAKREAAKRRARPAKSAAKSSAAKKSGSTSFLGTRRRKILAIGSAVGVAAGAAALLSRRRNAFEPPAEAPPRLEDYADATVDGPSTRNAKAAAPE